MSATSHPELEKENSLTSPEDRNPENKWKPDQSTPALTEKHVENAMNALNNTAFVDKFPRVDRTYADPPPPMQTIGLVSFTPAKGATPNSNGIYGFAKLRGNYCTEIEANQRAEFLIRNVDSYHQIYHCYVGRPFPLTESSNYSAETSEIDIRKQTVESVSSNIKHKKQDEQRQIDEIKQREKELIEDTQRDERDPYEFYITLKVKKAQLTWNWLEHQKKIEEIKNIIIKTREELQELDTEHPDFEHTYYDKYIQARKDAGIKESKEDAENNFIKFLVEDAELPF
jgi:hypothetical protein